MIENHKTADAENLKSKIKNAGNIDKGSLN